jgi:hypothetical protein
MTLPRGILSLNLNLVNPKDRNQGKEVAINELDKIQDL